MAASSGSRSSAAAAALAICLGGCQGAAGVYAQLQEEIHALQVVLTGGSSPIAAKRREKAEKELQLGANARKAKENAELLQEMYRVVLLASPSDRRLQEDFAGLVNSLNQGASLEGVYNGMTHSAEFRKLESGGSTASPSALTAFGELVAGLDAELPSPTLFDASSAQPLVVINSGEEVPESRSSKLKQLGSGAPVSGADAKAISTLFVGASVYTLKRVAGDEAFKTIAAKRAVAEVSRWYGKWAVQLASRKVDFGLDLRNKADEKFHTETAQRFNDDRLRWEVLNRIHRVLNQADGRKIP